jgi:hypothetical protein
LNCSQVYPLFLPVSHLVYPVFRSGLRTKGENESDIFLVCILDELFMCDLVIVIMYFLELQCWNELKYAIVSICFHSVKCLAMTINISLLSEIQGSEIWTSNIFRKCHQQRMYGKYILLIII